jgi:hypothetical protein
MKATRALFALVIAAAAPFAAQAEQRFGEAYPIATTDAPSTLSAAQVRADYLAMSRSGQRFGEAYPVATTDSASVRTRQDVRSDFLAMDRSGQRFGEAYPGAGSDSTLTSVAGMHADIR